MAGKMTLWGGLEEELMEAQAFFSNFATDFDKLQPLLEKNEALDHENDKTLSEAQGFLLEGLEALSCLSYGEVTKFIHAAIEKLDAQQDQDLADDHPRDELKLKIELKKQAGTDNLARLTKLEQQITVPEWRQRIADVKRRYTEFLATLDEIIKCLKENEKGDHRNDKLRKESRRKLLQCLKHDQNKDYTLINSIIFQVIKKIQAQALLDIRDDIPRTKCKMKLVQLKYDCIQHLQHVLRVSEELSKRERG